MSFTFVTVKSRWIQFPRRSAGCNLFVLPAQHSHAVPVSFHKKCLWCDSPWQHVELQNTWTHPPQLFTYSRHRHVIAPFRHLIWFLTKGTNLSVLVCSIKSRSCHHIWSFMCISPFLVTYWCTLLSHVRCVLLAVRLFLNEICNMPCLGSLYSSSPVHPHPYTSCPSHWTVCSSFTRYTSASAPKFINSSTSQTSSSSFYRLNSRGISSGITFIRMGHSQLPHVSETNPIEAKLQICISQLSYKYSAFVSLAF